MPPSPTRRRVHAGTRGHGGQMPAGEGGVGGRSGSKCGDCVYAAAAALGHVQDAWRPCTCKVSASVAMQQRSSSWHRTISQPKGKKTKMKKVYDWLCVYGTHGSIGWCGMVYRSSCAWRCWGLGLASVEVSRCRSGRQHSMERGARATHSRSTQSVQTKTRRLDLGLDLDTASSSGSCRPLSASCSAASARGGRGVGAHCGPPLEHERGHGGGAVDVNDAADMDERSGTSVLHPHRNDHGVASGSSGGRIWSCREVQYVSESEHTDRLNGIHLDLRMGSQLARIKQEFPRSTDLQSQTCWEHTHMKDKTNKIERWMDTLVSGLVLTELVNWAAGLKSRGRYNIQVLRGLYLLTRHGHGPARGSQGHKALFCKMVRFSLTVQAQWCAHFKLRYR
ncbi:hypothetical protein DFH07DRAFT_766074 [Mycena maculata]|uniref:Uncharacterized protein n=1 Tax=Mycena maculata TaxID=230809 RepID=A0AAD7K3V3_9AGAR|nr:hypothetical protein DFH07DRAFT_766074 [Mycena maculata]